MAIIRSPNYPSMSLPEAIARVAVVHEKEQHLAAPREVVAKHMGFKSLNGSSLKALSALLKYGLLEKIANDQRRVTDLAVRILHPSDPADRGAAIAEAAGRPTLFKEIANNWPDGSPSDENLKSWLIRRQFAADAVADVIKAYRDTLALVARESGAYDSGDLEEAEPEMHMPPTKEPAGLVAAQSTLPTPPGTEDPYYFTFKPSDGFEGGFRLKSLGDFEALIHMLNGFKVMYQPLSGVSLPLGHGGPVGGETGYKA